MTTLNYSITVLDSCHHQVKIVAVKRKKGCETEYTLENGLFLCVSDSYITSGEEFIPVSVGNNDLYLHVSKIA